jgi:beta-lactamase superfamily II metal-dependent hydrolase
MPDSASLEIHVINVGQGDSVLVINRDLAQAKNAIAAAAGSASVPANPIDYVPYALKNGVSLVGTVKKALLVDGGDDEYGGDVLNYMTDQGVLDGTSVWRPDLSVVVSHYHDDHMAGLRSVFKERIDPKKKGDAVQFVERLRPAVVYQSLPDTKTNPTTQRFDNFQDDVATAASAATNPTQRAYVYPGGLDGPGGTAQTMQIDLGTGVSGIPMTVYILASGQAVWDASKNLTVPVASVGYTVDQNDRSVVLMLEYGSFRCLLGGDIAGNGLAAGGNFDANAVDPSTKKSFSTHGDVESVLGPALEAYFPKTTTWVKGQPKFPADGHATVFKANHHGSSSSIDVHFLATVQPIVFVGSSGVKARFHRHPTQEVMNRITYDQTDEWGRRAAGTVLADAVKVDNTIAGIYLTEVAEKVKNKAFGVDIYDAEIMGDTVIRPVDETISALQDATAPGQELTVQVYGVGVLTDLSDPDTILRPPTSPNPATNIYPIGPITHSRTY